MKRFIGFILVFLLLVTAMPMFALADPTEYEIAVGEELFFSYTPENSGEYKVYFTVTESNVYFFEFEHDVSGVYLYQKSGEEYVNKDSARFTKDIYFRMEAGEYYIDIEDRFNNQNKLQLKPAGDLQEFALYRDYCVIPVGESMIISYNASPSNVLIDKIIYFSDNEDLLEITEHGGAIAKKAGRATISFTAVDVHGNEITDSMEIIVTDIINWDVSQPVTLTAGGNIIKRVLEFTVEETGFYEIYSQGSSELKGINPEGRLFSGGKQLAYDYDTYNEDFSIKYSLTAGEVYKLIVSNSADIPNEFTVNIRPLSDDYASKPVCETVNLSVGEEHTVKFINEADFTLAATQTDVVEIKDKTIIAKAEGTASVTATLDETTAEINVTVAPVKELAINTVTDIAIDDMCSKRYFKFVAPEDGEYVFYAIGNTDNYGALYNSAGASVGYSDDNSGYNFVINRELVKDEVYYLETGNLWGDQCNYQIVAAAAENATVVNMELAQKDYIAETEDGYITYNSLNSMFFDYIITFGNGLGAIPTGHSIQATENENGDLYVRVDADNNLFDFFIIKRIEYAYGDINFDGRFDGSDYDLLNGYLQGENDLTDHQLIVADANGDMAVNTADLQILATVICERFNHSISFAADGNRINVTCTVEGVPCTDNHQGELTIVAEGGEYDGVPYYASVRENITQVFPDVVIGEIKYVGTGDTVYAETTAAPANIGTYKVTITVGGVTAETELVITEVPPKYTRGDVNLNGRLDARDYLLLKRAFFKTYDLQCDSTVSDINLNGRLDARDYLLLKRAFFKTYTIQ